MKKVIITLLFFLPILSFAQWKNISFKAGIYTPYDLKSGAIYGIDYGTRLNENIVFMLGGDLYYKSIVNDAYLTNEEKLGVKIKTGQRLNEWIGWHFPLTAKLKVEFPIERVLIKPYVVGGVGYGITHVSYETYNNLTEDSETESLTYNGFVWQVGGGIMLRLGHRANLLFEVMHNSAYFEKEERYNQFSVLNSSGVLFRVGIDFQI
jgi:opacity protein-like surface antigen